MNPFAAFKLEPAPALNTEALKQDFNQATSATHPDKFLQGPERQAAEVRYAALNQAYQMLMDPRQRLLSLYELEQGKKPSDVQRIPPGTMDLFMEVGQICQNLDAHLKSKRNASGVLAKANLISEELSLQETLLTLGSKLEKFAETLQEEITSLDLQWRAGEKQAALLEVLYRKFSYLARWRQQLEEREIALITDEV